MRMLAYTGLLILIIHGLIPSSQAGQYQSYGRRCYHCQSVGRGGRWDKCSRPLRPETARESGIPAKVCYANCYVKVSQTGEVERGCYNNHQGVVPTRLGCQMQNNAIYCFCEGDSCNSQAPPTAGMAKRRAPAKPLKTEVISAAASREVVHSMETPFAVNQHAPRNKAVQKYQPYRRPQTYTAHQVGSYKRRSGQENHAHNNQHHQLKHARNYNRDIVHGDIPRSYKNRDGSILRVAQRKRTYHEKDEDKREHNVHVSTQNEHENRNYDAHQVARPGENAASNHNAKDIVREYVEHTEKQRNIQSKERMGDEDRNAALVGLPQNGVAEGAPHIAQRQTKHFHKYNVADRTIEHFIVEHYVLHHRIKEHLKNRHGIDVKNIDPRTISLIYKMLHPNKHAELTRLQELRGKN